MKELIMKSQNFLNQKNTATVWALSLHIFVGVLSFVAARGIIFDTLIPFGLVFVGGCSLLLLPSVAIGAFLGYFIPATGSGGFKYLAALLAIVAARLLLVSYRRISKNPFFLGALTVTINATTSIVSYSGIPLDLLKLAAECIIILGSVFVVSRSFVTLSHNYSGFTFDEMICLVGTSVIILIGLIDISVFEISLGRVIGVFLLLCAARYGGCAISSILGIALSFACLVTNSYGNEVVFCAFIGLVTGIFRSLGKYAIFTSAIATGIIAISFSQHNMGSPLFLIEIIVSSVLFLLIPRSFGIHLSKFFYKSPTVNTTNDAATAVGMRLQLASNALLDVSNTVTQVSHELAKINAPDFKSILGLIEQDACAGCKLRLHCWENKAAATLESVMQMINCIKGGENLDTAPLEEFRGRCIRVNKMQDVIKYRYSQYAAHIAAEDRIQEVRQVVSEQFEGVANMLRELSNFSNDEHFNTHAATTAASTLKNIGIHTEECTAKIDKFGRMTLEIKIKFDDSSVLNRLQIMKMLSIACERNFSPPTITKSGNSALITLNEHPTLRIDIGVEQHGAVAGNICGDAYKFFNDGKGRFVMILSDGMGTGGRAAVDGAMASGLMAQLLKAGLGFDCSLKILNSSMLFKSSDESLASMDIATIDLFTGHTKLYKAGAAPTLVRRNGHFGHAESRNLPIGILKDVSFDCAGIRLRHGDILLLVSDGVTFDGTDWIRQELEAWGDGGAQDLAEHICDCARRRYTDVRPDDITVMAAILEKNI